MGRAPGSGSAIERPELAPSRYRTLRPDGPASMLITSGCQAALDMGVDLLLHSSLSKARPPGLSEEPNGVLERGILGLVIVLRIQIFDLGLGDV